MRRQARTCYRFYCAAKQSEGNLFPAKKSAPACAGIQKGPAFFLQAQNQLIKFKTGFFPIKIPWFSQSLACCFPQISKRDASNRRIGVELLKEFETQNPICENNPLESGNFHAMVFPLL